MKLLITAALLATTTIPAMAMTTGNNGNGNGGCGVGQTTNGCRSQPTTNTPGNTVGGSVGSISNTNTAAGGEANAYSGNAVTGPISNSNTSTGGSVGPIATNSTALGGTGGNANANVNAQGGQGGAGGNAVTGPVSNSLSNDAANTNTNANNSNASSNQSQSSNNTNTNSSSVTVEGDRFAANTAIAPSLVVGSDTCMGSSSAGGQGMAFGFSVGTSWTDKNCVRLKNSRQLQALGYNDAALQLMCLDKDVRKAMMAAGTLCAATTKE